MTAPTPSYEIRARLGDGWTEDQIEQITERYLQLEQSLNIEDPEERDALLKAIAQHVDGVLDRIQLVENDVTARIHAAEARRALRAATRVEIAAGMTEAEAARLYGVDRMTIRAWLGK